MALCMLYIAQMTESKRINRIPKSGRARRPILSLYACRQLDCIYHFLSTSHWDHEAIIAICGGETKLQTLRVLSSFLGHCRTTISLLQFSLLTRYGDHSNLNPILLQFNVSMETITTSLENPRRKSDQKYLKLPASSIDFQLVIIPPRDIIRFFLCHTNIQYIQDHIVSYWCTQKSYLVYIYELHLFVVRPAQTASE